MSRTNGRPNDAGEGFGRARDRTGDVRRRLRASRLAGGLAGLIVLGMIVAYVFSMVMGSMGHGTSGGVTSPHDSTVSAQAPALEADDQSVGGSGNATDADQHSGEDSNEAADLSDHVVPGSAETDHQTSAGGSINWYVVAGFIAFISLCVAIVASVKENLARCIVAGTAVSERLCNE